jgi:hypothetical protein
MTQGRPVTLAIVFFATIMLLPATSDAATLSVEERVERQSRIEEIYWRNRIWPDENPGTKPSLAEVMPPAAIRSKVESDLLKKELLASEWGRTFSAEEIQAELDRMARSSKAPRRLLEIFAALDNDPGIIAECLVEPILVDRAIRELYAFDPQLHGELRATAEAAIEIHPGVEEMHLLGGEYSETVLELESQATESNMARPEPNRRRLSPEDWQRQVSELPAGPEPVLSALREERDRFVVSAVLERGTDETCVATVSWQKQSFNEWLASRAAAEPSTAVPWSSSRTFHGRSLELHPGRVELQIAGDQGDRLRR